MWCVLALAGFAGGLVTFVLPQPGPRMDHASLGEPGEPALTASAGSVVSQASERSGRQPSAPPAPADQAPESGEGSIEGEGVDDDLGDRDDFAYSLRLAVDDCAGLNREAERRAAAEGRAFSRLEDHRSDKPPRG